MSVRTGLSRADQLGEGQPGGIARLPTLAGTAGWIAVACVALAVAVTASLAAAAPARGTEVRVAGLPRVPPLLASSCGHPISRSEPSRLAPPPANLLRGFTLSYCTDFPGRGIPPGWFKFSGVPAGDPSGLFVGSHVAVSGGQLSIKVTKHHGSQWATGGICHCGLPRLYGAFFVRSRVTGAGPDEIDLLWPVARVWPPEIDFNESSAHTGTTNWSVHYGGTHSVVHGGTRINLTRWHTWGVIWTAHFVRFLVDGHPWGAVTKSSEIPHQPMTLDIQNQTFCGRGTECPARPVEMQIDWVAEYAPSSSGP
jgi:hypothetical protein